MGPSVLITGDMVEVKGSLQSNFERVEPDAGVTSLLMVAAGTGVLPMLQVICALQDVAGLIWDLMCVSWHGNWDAPIFLWTTQHS